jgi:tetratricopeptide (TPR) repeat protein
LHVWRQRLDTLGDVLDAMIAIALDSRSLHDLSDLLKKAIQIIRSSGDPEGAAELALQFADLLQGSAQERGFPPFLQFAKIIYDEGLGNASSSKNPDLWRRIMTHKANALQRSGQLSENRVSLIRSVEAYEHVLSSLTAQEALARGIVLSNQANARLSLARLTGIGEKLNEAVTSFQLARATLPIDGPRSTWLKATTGLADALRQRGAVLSEPDDLKQAISLYENALADVIDKASRADLAMVFNSLGMAQFRLSEIDGNTELASQAETNHLKARRIYEQDGPGHDLAQTLLNLGNVYVRLGERGGPGELLKAHSCYEGKRCGGSTLFAAPSRDLLMS